ncbi:MAG: right-handed parallel beta-helix repeat-containing protein [Spirochaetaceae bacterium]|jgi:hypothetical protein|nr:right-handed parallel beta-helix repeat-containing protein [Spirochaetaceae bacterium]
MKQNDFRGIAMAVVVFALGIIAVGFTGCDFLEDFVSIKIAEEPVITDPPPDPLTLDAFMTLYIKSDGNDDTNTGETDLAPLVTVAKALEKVRERYGNGGEWGVTVTETAKTKYPLPAEIVVLDTITPSVTGTIDGAEGGGPPIILRYLRKEDQDNNDTTTKNYPLVTMNTSDVELTLKNITFKGMAANTAPLIRVESGGTLIMRSGARLMDNTNTKVKTYGGGVFVGSGGTFEMWDGTISGNRMSKSNSTGGGVYVASGGTFTMKGGIISENSAAGDRGGGVYVFNGGTFTMEGGFIEHNTAKYGGGVYLFTTAKFKKTGGTIYGAKKENGYDEDSDKMNIVVDEPTKDGVAVYSEAIVKVRTTTAGTGVDLHSPLLDDGTDDNWEERYVPLP